MFAEPLILPKQAQEPKRPKRAARKKASGGKRATSGRSSKLPNLTSAQVVELAGLPEAGAWGRRRN